MGCGDMMLHTFLFLREGEEGDYSVRWGYESRLLKRELLFEGCVEETVWGLHVDDGSTVQYII